MWLLFQESYMCKKVNDEMSQIICKTKDYFQIVLLLS